MEIVAPQNPAFGLVLDAVLPQKQSQTTKEIVPPNYMITALKIMIGNVPPMGSVSLGSEVTMALEHSINNATQDTD